MAKYRVTMICREIWRAETIVDSVSSDLEEVKDRAWAGFDMIKEPVLEQENSTKVEIFQP